MSTHLPNLHMMPWFPGDFLASTRGWPLISRAIYRELLDAQWGQGALPPEPSDLRQIVGATPTEWRAGWSRVEPKFPVSADGLRRNYRLEQHRQKAVEIALKRAKIGRSGGLASGAKRQANAKQLLPEKPSNWSSKGQPSTPLHSEEAYEGGLGVVEDYLRSTGA